MIDMAQTIDSLVRHLALLDSAQAAVALLFAVFVVSVGAILAESTLYKFFAFRTAKLYATERQNTLLQASKMVELNAAAIQQLSLETRQMRAEIVRSTARIHDLVQATRFVQDQVVELAHGCDGNPRLDVKTERPSRQDQRSLWSSHEHHPSIRSEES